MVCAALNLCAKALFNLCKYIQNTMTTSGAINPDITSGKNKSVWLESMTSFATDKIKASIKADVLVIGGGIAGLTTAYALVKEGKKVLLAEDGYIGSGESGRTTGHVTCALDDRYYEIEKLFGQRKTMLAANSQLMAIQWLDKVIRAEQINCHYKNVPGYLFLHETDSRESIEKEYAATRRAGIFTELVNEIPGFTSVPGNIALKFPGQRQFHIIKYLKGLADAIQRNGGLVFTESKAESISKEGAEINGFRVKAESIVVATNSPVNDMVTMHTKQWPFRTYVVCMKVPKNSLPSALWWDTGNHRSEWNTYPYHYVRLFEQDNYDLLVSGGEDHATGRTDKDNVPEEERFTKLVEWTRNRFPVAGEIVHQWSGQVMEPVDSMAYAGRNPGDENVYIITGDSGNGLTNATVGGIIVNDLICGRENMWAELYSPSRSPLRSAGTYVSEALRMVGSYKEWFKQGDLKALPDLKAGSGGIYTSGLKKIALYRDNNNKLFAYSAVCPHMGAIIQWNAEEKTFDCPAHGSRFAPTGEVINGPAISDLKPIEFKE